MLEQLLALLDATSQDGGGDLKRRVGSLPCSGPLLVFPGGWGVGGIWAPASKSLNGLRAQADIKQVAQAIGVAPGIVVGRM